MELKKKTQSFTLVGKAKINDFTFNLDKRSESNFIYNSMNLNVFCGEKHGGVLVDLMGGYMVSHPMDLYAHGKKEDGLDDFSNQIMVAWADRQDKQILNTLGELCFIKVGLLKDDDGKTIIEKFLSPYDAIKYINEHLKNDMTIYVKGSLSYDYYDGKVIQHKRVNTIYLSEREEKDFFAKFKQTILLDKDSSKLENVDKDKMVLYVRAKIIDRVKNYKGTSYTGLAALPFTFEFPIDVKDMKKTKDMIDFMFKVRRGITELSVEGNIVEGGKVSNVKLEDMDQDIQRMVNFGLMSEEEAQAKYTDGSKERRLIITAPLTRQEEVDGVKKVCIDKVEEKYTEDDLVINLNEYKPKEDSISIQPQEETVMKTHEVEEIDLKALFGD